MKNYLARIIGKSKELFQKVLAIPVSENSKNQIGFIAGAVTLAVALVQIVRMFILGE